MSTDQVRIDSLRRVVNRATAELYDAVIEACPGPHDPIQHRDRRPAWCHVCRRDAAGFLHPEASAS